MDVPGYASNLSFQENENSYFYVWLSQIKEGENKCYSKFFFDKYLSWQKGPTLEIDYDKVVLTHLFNETLLKCSVDERTKIVANNRQLLNGNSLLKKIPEKLTAIGRLIVSEPFLRESIIVVSVSFLTGTISYLLIRYLASPIITSVGISIGEHFPSATQAATVVYRRKVPILAGRFILIRGMKDECRLKKVIIPISIFLDCTLFLRIQLMRMAGLYCYKIVKFADPNLTAFEETCIKRIKETVAFIAAKLKERDRNALKEAFREKWRTLKVDYRLGYELVQLREAWIAACLFKKA